MADFDTAARPYAKAIFELASEEGNLQYWSDSLQVAAVVASDVDMQAMFQLPSMLANEHCELFLSVVSAVKDVPRVSAEFKNLIALLAQNNRLAALPSIATAFDSLKQEAEGRIEVVVRTAQKLSGKQQATMAESLAKKLGKEINITTEIDESLIAGAIIHVGDTVIDGSTRSRLDKLTTVLNK
ncbi:MAG: F0F1 ATP synthase subunit delta [Gammaproteobacteria bacterium]|nr:F0F1 ATP synthase subunit delta [Gammaproteobacteria bacterium]